MSPRTLLIALTAAFALDHLDRQILSITLDMIGREFALSDLQLGTLSGLAFAVVYVVLGFPLARLAKRGFRKTMVIGTLGVWSAMTLLTGFATSYVHLLLARIGVGVGEAGYAPSAHAMISDAFPPEQRTAAFGVFSAGVNIGLFIAFLLGGVVASMYGWRAAFFIAGLPGLLLATVFVFYLREPKPPADDPAGAGEGARRYRDLAREMIADGIIRHVLIGAILISLVNYGSIAWFATWLLRTQGLGIAQVGAYLAAVVGIGGALGVWLGGWLANAAGARYVGGALAFVALSIVLTEPLSITAYLIAPGPIVLWIIVLPAAAANIYVAPTFATIYSRLAPSDRPMATAILMLCFNLIGLGLGPTIVGFASDVLAGQGTTRAPLAIALAAMQCVTFWGGFHFLLAARKARKAEPAPAIDPTTLST